jgi:hypothetical protein
VSNKVNSSSAQHIEMVPFEEAQAAAACVAKTSSAPPQGAVVERWRGQSSQPEGPHCAHSGPTSTAQELLAEANREASKRTGAKEAIAQLEAPVHDLALRHKSSGDIKNFEISHASFGRVAAGSGVHNALNVLSRETVSGLIMGQVQRAWPKANPDEVEALTQRLVGQLADGAVDQVAMKMRDTAVGMMQQSATSFLATAKNPEELNRIASQLRQLSGPGASKESLQLAQNLRDGLGLTDGVPANPTNLAEAMNERARVIQHEAKSLQGSGIFTLYRSLLHHNVKDQFIAQANIQPGSFAESLLQRVAQRGGNEQQTIDNVKYLSSLALSAATGGLGLGVFIGAGASALLAAPSIAHAWAEVDVARAGESSGTMASGAARSAKDQAIRETAVEGLTMMAAGAISHGSHHQVEKLAGALERVASKPVVDALAHVAIHDAAHRTFDKLIGQEKQSPHSP